MRASRSHRAVHRGLVPRSRGCALIGALITAGFASPPAHGTPSTPVRVLLPPELAAGTGLSPPLARSPARAFSGVVVGPGCRVVTGATPVRDAIAVVVGVDTPAEIAWIADDLGLAVLVGASRDCGPAVRLDEPGAPRAGAPAVVAAAGRSFPVTVAGYADAPDDLGFGVAGDLPPAAAGAAVRDEDGALLGVLRGPASSGRGAVVPAAVIAALLAAPEVQRAMTATQRRVGRWWRGPGAPPTSALLALETAALTPRAHRARGGAGPAIRRGLRAGTHPSPEVRVLLAAALWNLGARRATHYAAAQQRRGCREVDEAHAALRGVRREHPHRAASAFEEELENTYLLHPRLGRACGRSLEPAAGAAHVTAARPGALALPPPAAFARLPAGLFVLAPTAVTLDLAAALPHLVVGVGMAYRHSSEWDAAIGRARRLEAPLALRRDRLRLEAGPVLRLPAGVTATPGLMSRLAVGDDSWSLGVSILDSLAPTRRETLQELNLRLRF